MAPEPTTDWPAKVNAPVIGELERCGIDGGLGKVAGALDHVGDERHRHAFAVLQLRHAALHAGGALHGLDERQQSAGQKERDQDRDHELDQGEAALTGVMRGDAASMARVTGSWLHVEHVGRGLQRVEIEFCCAFAATAFSVHWIWMVQVTGKLGRGAGDGGKGARQERLQARSPSFARRRRPSGPSCSCSSREWSSCSAALNSAPGPRSRRCWGCWSRSRWSRPARCPTPNNPCWRASRRRGSMPRMAAIERAAATEVLATASDSIFASPSSPMAQTTSATITSTRLNPRQACRRRRFMSNSPRRPVGWSSCRPD